MVETNAVYTPQIINIKEFDEDGNVIGERNQRVIGIREIEINGQKIKQYIFGED